MKQPSNRGLQGTLSHTAMCAAIVATGERHALPTGATAPNDERLQLIDDNFEFVERKGKVFLKKLAGELKALGLPRGGYVIVNVLTGDYVTGASRREAMVAYRSKYKGSPGWASRIEDVGNG